MIVISQKQKAALREPYKNKKFIPLDLRPKKTRAIRGRLTKYQISLKTAREKKKEMYCNLTVVDEMYACRFCDYALIEKLLKVDHDILDSLDHY